MTTFMALGKIVPRTPVSRARRIRVPLTSLPNLLTLSRILAIPVVVATFYLSGDYARWLGCALFAAAGFTDWLDGHFARRWEQQSELGRFLDPIADKLLVAATLFMLTVTARLSSHAVLPALVILLVAIGVLIVGDAGWHVLPIVTIGETLLWLAALLTIVTGYDYLRAGLAHIAAPRAAGKTQHLA
jgi:cardiolipin synthase